MQLLRLIFPHPHKLDDIVQGTDDTAHPDNDKGQRCCLKRIEQNEEAEQQHQDGKHIQHTSHREQTPRSRQCGQLIDTKALIHGIESEHVGGAGLDTIEGEEGICHVDIKTRISTKENIFYLKQFPNVIYTPHIGFFTEEAVYQMVESSFLGIACATEGKDSPYLVK